MNKSMKAPLLSALVFPGAGHFFLKKYFPGAVLACTALAGVYFLIAKTVERVLQITKKLESGEVQLDVAAILELVSKEPGGTASQHLNVATAVLISSWFIGIVDSYRVGRVQDKDAESGG